MLKKWFFAIFFSVFLNSLIPYFLNSSLAYAYTEKTYYIHQDNLGSVVATTDENGNLVTENSYSSYGNSVGDDFYIVPKQEGQILKSVPTERSYTGQIKDTSTSLQYYNARYYDPILSRFISADSVQGGNRYAYVSNNPISNSDPSGNYKIADGDLNNNSKGYDSKFFDDIIQQNFFSNKTLMHEWRNGEMSPLEKAGAIVEFTRRMTPYFPGGNTPSLGNYLNDINKQINYAQRKAEDFHYSGLDYASNVLLYQRDLLYKIRPPIYDYEVFRKKMMKNFENIQQNGNAIDMFNNKVWVCWNFALQAASYIKKYVPEVDVSPVQIGVQQGSEGHEIIAVQQKGDNIIYSGDPTPGWNYWVTGVIPLTEDIAKRGSILDFTSYEIENIPYPFPNHPNWSTYTPTSNFIVRDFLNNIQQQIKKYF